MVGGLELRLHAFDVSSVDTTFGLAPDIERDEKKRDQRNRDFRSRERPPRCPPEFGVKQIPPHCQPEVGIKELAPQRHPEVGVQRILHNAILLTDTRPSMELGDSIDRPTALSPCQSKLSPGSNTRLRYHDQLHLGTQ